MADEVKPMPFEAKELSTEKNKVPSNFTSSKEQIVSKKFTAQQWKVISVLGFGTVMATLDGSIVNIALPTIAEKLQSGDSIQWIVLAYTLAITSTLLTMGRISDLVGKKKTYILGFGVFTLASVLCGISWDIWSLVGFRILQGLGASMIFSVAPSIVVETFPPQQRGRALGIMGSTVALGSSLGPVIGGFLINVADWPAIFWVNLPLGVIAMWRAYAIIPNYDKTMGQKFDFLGSAVFCIALIIFLTGLHYAPEPHYGWGHPMVLSFLIIGLALVFLFIQIERKVQDPMLNLIIFKNGAFTSAIAGTLIAFTALGAHLFVFPFYLQEILHFSAQQAGLILLASTLTLSISSPLGGVLSDKFGARIVSTIGLGFVATALLLISFMNSAWGWEDIIWRLSMLAFGMGIFQSPNSTSALNNAPAAQRGVASSMISFNRNLGSIFGVALAAAIWYSLRSFPAGASLPASNQLLGMSWVYRTMALLICVGAFISYNRDRYEQKV